MKVLKGTKFNRLTILDKTGRPGGYVNAKCDCGTVKEIRVYYIISGKTKSCGCLNKERAKKAKYFYHNMYGTRPYSIWQGMKGRCSDTKHQKNRKNYFLRGIKVEWKDFQEFWKDMKEGYADDLELDRIDNNGNYSKINCRWVTRVENSNNKRTNRYIELNGVRKTVTQWAAYMGYKPALVSDRLDRGWSIKKAIETKI